ncbi:hypothetical protein SRHO_G00301330 [Serrasalmus rhombeus]
MRPMTRPLAQTGIHFSFMDVMFELVVLGVFGGARTHFPNDIFAGEVYLYLLPESLATVEWECLQRHIQLLIERLQAI